MALRKYDTVNSEQFVTPIRGLYSEHVISIEDFKDCNVELMKNRWINTTHGNKDEKIYELFDPDTDGEIVKESMQEWLCNRHQITECIGIALWNHEFTYLECFKYVDAKSGPDELALYSLARKYGIHTSVYNKSYVWTTLMNHISRTDEEIFKLSGVNLVYLGPTVYGIIREICARNQVQLCSNLDHLLTRQNAVVKLHVGIVPVGVVASIQTEPDAHRTAKEYSQ